MKIEAATRRANFWLFIGLVAFAILLCALVLVWMRTRTHEQGGRVYPPVTINSIILHGWLPFSRVGWASRPPREASRLVHMPGSVGKSTGQDAHRTRESFAATPTMPPPSKIAG